MARHQETSAFPTTYDADDDYEDTAAASGCGCFRRFCFGLDGEEGHSYLLQENKGGVTHKDAWLVAKLKKLREWSELVAGPQWKNMIRKIGKICNPRIHNNKTATAQFLYSPESYALNFAGDDQDEDGNLLHSFSTRFAPGFFINDQQNRPAM